MIAYKTAHTRTCNKRKQQYTQRIDGMSSKYVAPLNQGNLHKHKSCAHHPPQKSRHPDWRDRQTRETHFGANRQISD